MSVAVTPILGVASTSTRTKNAPNNPPINCPFGTSEIASTFPFPKKRTRKNKAAVPTTKDINDASIAPTLFPSPPFTTA